MNEEQDSMEQISIRLGLGRPRDGTSIYQKRDTTQVAMFLRLLDISDKSRHFAGWSWERYPKIPFTIIAMMSSLKQDEQDKIIQSSYNDDKKRVILKKDVLKILAWKRDNPDISIGECIEKILKLKPVVITRYMVVCELRDRLRNFIDAHKDYKNTILRALGDNINGRFYGVDSTKTLITISMDETAYKTFHEKQYRKNIPFTDFLNLFSGDKIGW